MYLKILTPVLLLVISLNSCNGLECTYTEGDLSFCQPGGSITLYNPTEIDEKQLVLRNDQTGHTDDACCEIIHCERNGCKGVNNCENGNSCVDNNAFSTLTALTNYSKLSRYLARYCNPGPSASCVCTYHSSASQINILCDGELVNPSCSIELSEKESGDKALSLTCTWEKGYFGVEATLDIPHSQRDPERKCSAEESSVKAGLFSPNIFLKGATQTKASCTLTMPNLPNVQPTCEFSHYITPTTSDIKVGESLNLTCPSGAGSVTWWEITTEDIISLESNISSIAPMTGIFCARTPNVSGFIIMCKDGTPGNKYKVLGIGKIIVREVSSEEASTDISSCFFWGSSCLTSSW